MGWCVECDRRTVAKGVNCCSVANPDSPPSAKAEPIHHLHSDSFEICDPPSSSPETTLAFSRKEEEQVDDEYARKWNFLLLWREVSIQAYRFVGFEELLTFYYVRSVLVRGS